MVNRPLIRPYFLGGELWGGSLDSHDRGGLNKWCVGRMSLAKEFVKQWFMLNGNQDTPEQ